MRWLERRKRIYSDVQDDQLEISDDDSIAILPQVSFQQWGIIGYIMCCLSMARNDGKKSDVTLSANMILDT
jgi:hypothetical protein